MKRFEDKYQIMIDGCWIWTAYRDAAGYGQFSVGSRTDGSRRKVYAHRFAYQLHRGPIPGDLELDHLCRVRSCVNPWHLEAVTHAENVRRGTAGAVATERNRAKIRCPRGHPYDEVNTWRDRSGARHCRACARARMRARREARRAVAS